MPKSIACNRRGRRAAVDASRTALHTCAPPGLRTCTNAGLRRIGSCAIARLRISQVSRATRLYECTINCRSVTQRSSIPAGLSGMINEGAPVTPRPAATVLLVDPTQQPSQVLMMRRPGGADFAPGAYVFPGGSVHTEDAELGDESRAAAVRELFEEVGILLARRSDGRFARDRECSRLRDKLTAGVGWIDGLRGLRLTP